MWFIDEFSTKSIDEKLVFLKGLSEVDPQQSNSPLISHSSIIQITEIVTIIN